MTTPARDVTVSIKFDGNGERTLVVAKRGDFYYKVRRCGTPDIAQRVARNIAAMDNGRVV